MAADSSPERSITHGEWKQHSLNETTKTPLRLHFLHQILFVSIHVPIKYLARVGPCSAVLFRAR